MTTISRRTTGITSETIFSKNGIIIYRQAMTIDWILLLTKHNESQVFIKASALTPPLLMIYIRLVHTDYKTNQVLVGIVDCTTFSLFGTKNKLILLSWLFFSDSLILDLQAIWQAGTHLLENDPISIA